MEAVGPGAAKARGGGGAQGRPQVEKFQHAVAYLEGLGAAINWPLLLVAVLGLIIVALLAYCATLLVRAIRQLREVSLTLNEMIGELGGIREGVNSVRVELGGDRILGILRELQGIRAATGADPASGSRAK